MCFVQMSIEDFTMYGGAFGNKQDTAFPNVEVRRVSSLLAYNFSMIYPSHLKRVIVEPFMMVSY